MVGRVAIAFAATGGLDQRAMVASPPAPYEKQEKRRLVTERPQPEVWLERARPAPARRHSPQFARTVFATIATKG